MSVCMFTQRTSSYYHLIVEWLHFTVQCISPLHYNFSNLKRKESKYRIRYLVKKSVQNVFLDFFFIAEKNKILIA